ncbi:dehydrogenase [Candidatus Marinamargulisbacteria bacterium SCGC AG-410-N11]|nr:dehydrogenase [Candidatus Marinamargulisbacteria bacterium SCGC AG-410-N11]
MLTKNKIQTNHDRSLFNSVSLIRSKAPLRLGFSGGGTDVSPYCDIHGGSVLNITINLFAHASIKPLNQNLIIFKSICHNLNEEIELCNEIPLNGNFKLAKATYNRIIKDFNINPPSFELTTKVDAPPGSGLGSSSTLVVAMVSAFSHWLNLPLSDYDIASLAFKIEREDCQMQGGKQDQYAATFGGVNFMEFSRDKVIVNPLRLKDTILQELNHNIVLFNLGQNRNSSTIIQKQANNSKSNIHTINALHCLKKDSIKMKNALITGDLNQVGNGLAQSWEFKKKLTSSITSPYIDDVYNTAVQNGAIGGKVSGAGGGGHIMFYCPENSKYKVIESLKKFKGSHQPMHFYSKGAQSWSIKN